MSAEKAVLLHIYYVDLLDELVEAIAHFPCGFDLLVSTSDGLEQHVYEKLQSLSGFNEIVVRVTPNVGYDVAPMLVTFAKELTRYDVVCKLHTKASQGQSGGRAWRRWLYQTLSGSAKRVEHIVHLFTDSKIGLVYSATPPAFRQWQHWDKQMRVDANGLCNALGLCPSDGVDFAVGSMFWFRPAAILPLLNVNFSYQDFAENAKPKLAHAIERLMVQQVEQQGFYAHKLALSELNRDECSVENKRIALLLHCWSIQGIQRFPSVVRNLPVNSDVIVTVSSKLAARVERFLSKQLHGVNWRVVSVANKGHDYGGMVEVMGLLGSYELVCKLHLKQSDDRWLEYLWANLIGGVAEVNASLLTFERNPALGVLAPPPTQHAQPAGWGNNMSAAKKLANKLSVAVDFQQPIRFPEGSMFWFRPQALTAMAELSIDDFDGADNAQIDGTTSHALERLVPSLAEAAGYQYQNLGFHSQELFDDSAIS